MGQSRDNHTQIIGLQYAIPQPIETYYNYIAFSAMIIIGIAMRIGDQHKKVPEKKWHEPVMP